MDNYDAFTAGVEPGGLRNRNEIKLLIGFLAKSLDKPLTKTQLNIIMQQHGLANYFEVNQALSELLKSGNITTKINENEELLYPTDMGLASVRELEDDLPKSVKEKALNSAVELLTKARRERENNIEVKQVENGYNVTFTLSDKNELLMRLTVYAADIEQVETIRKGFLNDPIRLYSGIIAALSST
ncbi:MAG TPA: DUF4364 family protein [Clostridia bacterium]|nr:DUF4364 family protein [Clostridia bacterium]